jgi:Calcineurin-like phosphoesterase
VSETFRYIQLSDLHLCVEDSRHNILSLHQRNLRAFLDTASPAGRQRLDRGWRSLFKPASYVPNIVNGAARFCYDRRKMIDGVIVTGDLATTGRLIDLQTAETFIAAKASVGPHIDPKRATISGVEKPIHLLPGNHDKYINDVGSPNSPNFQLKFLNYMENLDPVDGVGYWIKQKNGKHLAFVYSDYTLQSRQDASNPAKAFGQGKVYPNVLGATEVLTRAISSHFPDVSIVWIIHFAPFDCGNNLELLDWAHILKAAERLGVICTLCGHTHDKMRVSSGLHTIYCAGSSGCIDREFESRLHMFEFEFGRYIKITRRNYLWSSTDQEFKEGLSD